MQLPLTKNSLLRPGTLLVALAFSTVLAPPQAQAQNRRARTSAKAKAPASIKAAKIRALETRLRKATATYNSLGQVVYGQAIFLVQGTTERGDNQRLVVYGKTYPQNEAAQRSLGQNNDDNFLTIHNPDPACIINGQYQGYCVVLSQTDFAPVPA